jgi:hypothetical protein
MLGWPAKDVRRISPVSPFRRNSEPPEMNGCGRMAAESSEERNKLRESQGDVDD